MEIKSERLADAGKGYLFGRESTLVRRWWAVLLRGVVSVLFGIVVLASPQLGLASLVALFGTLALLSAGFLFASALGAEREGRAWGVMVLEGILCVAAALTAFLYPGITLGILTLLIGVWALSTGIMQLVAAFRLRGAISNTWLLGLDGVLSIAFGIFALARPVIGAVAIVAVLGIYALFFGFAQIGLGFWLGHLKAKLPPRVKVPA
jgi:uncharacterized membrane protein HdeD (DUF308 family)